MKICQLIFILCLFACNTVNQDIKCFNGEIFPIADKVKVTAMPCDTIKVEGVYQGPIFIHDSLLLYYSTNFTAKSFYEIYNLKDQSFLGSFCYKGSGPGEFVGLTTIYNFYSNNSGDLKTLIYAANEKKLLEWNISKSLACKTTVFDSIIPYDYLVDGNLNAYNVIYRIDDNSLFTITPPEPLTIESTTVTLPLYEKRTIDTNKRLSTYPIYLKTPEGNKSNEANCMFFLSSFSGIKPDLSRVIQLMAYLHQFNIIDVNTGETKGFRLEDTPDFSEFQNRKGIGNAYHLGLGVSDQYICTLYNKQNKQHTLAYIYDWNGQLLRKIDLCGYYNQISVDNVNNRMYVREYNSEYIFCYDLNKI